MTDLRPFVDEVLRAAERHGLVVQLQRGEPYRYLAEWDVVRFEFTYRGLPCTVELSGALAGMIGDPAIAFLINEEILRLAEQGERNRIANDLLHRAG